MRLGGIQFGHRAPALIVATVIACNMADSAQTPRGSSFVLAAALQKRASKVDIKMRSLDELIEKKEPGIEVVRGWIREAKCKVEALSVERIAGENAVVGTQVSSRSPMGAIALETGGLLIDHGWVRVLGGGNPRLPRPIHEWNRLGTDKAKNRLPGALLVADDVLGGFFAINGDGLKGEPGHVFYYSPKTLEWEDVSKSYSEWLSRFIVNGPGSFYEGMRWQGWEQEVANLPGDRALSVYPFLFAAGPDISKRSRKAVRLEELWGLYVDSIPQQLQRR